MNPLIDYDKIPEMRENIKNVIDTCPDRDIASVMLAIQTMDDDQIAAMCAFQLVTNNFVWQTTTRAIMDQIRDYAQKGMKVTLGDLASILEMSLK